MSDFEKRNQQPRPPGEAHDDDDQWRAPSDLPPSAQSPHGEPFDDDVYPQPEDVGPRPEPEFAAVESPLQPDDVDASPDQMVASAVTELAPSWKYAPDAWRWVGRLNRRYVDTMFRMRSARVIPESTRARFYAMGLAPEAVEATLREIRSTEAWAPTWIETAQRYLGDNRRQVSAKNMPEAAQARRMAAFCYHSAQILLFDDDRSTALCRAAAASLFAQAQPYLASNVRRIEIPWRNHTLPAYVMTPEPMTRPTGMIVALNGASTSKEETLGWLNVFIRQGFTVLALDSPGTGEATSIGPYSAEHDDILDGVFELFADEPLIDLSQVVVMGISMGGNQAVRAAAHDRRIMAAIAVTPPYDPPRWLNRASPMVTAQLGAFANDSEVDPYEAASQYSLHEVVPSVRVPTLVIGAGRDMIVPPTEAQLLVARLGKLGTLLWYPNGGHCLFESVQSWTADAAQWLGAMTSARHEIQSAGGHLDAIALAEVGRQSLENPVDLDPGGDTSLDHDDEPTTRVLSPDEVAESGATHPPDLEGGEGDEPPQPDHAERIDEHDHYRLDPEHPWDEPRRDD